MLNVVSLVLSKTAYSCLQVGIDWLSLTVS